MEKGRRALTWSVGRSQYHHLYPKNQTMDVFIPPKWISMCFLHLISYQKLQLRNGYLGNPLESLPWSVPLYLNISNLIHPEKVVGSSIRDWSMEGSCIILIAPDWEIYIPVSGMFVYKYKYFFSAYFVTLPQLEIYRNTVLGKTSCEV